MDEEKKKEQEEIVKTINDGISALRDQQKTLEDAGVARDTTINEQKETIENITKKVDELEVENKKLTSLVTAKDVNEVVGYKEMLDWMRTGKAIDNAQEIKLMRLSDQTLGGYLASPEISNELIKDIVEYSPIRSIAKIRTTSKESVKIRKRTGVFSAAWTGEVTTKTETTGLTYGQEEIPTHELYALVDISNWDLEDSDFNLEAEIRAEFAEQFGVAEGTAFVSGNAVHKPEGILTNASIDHVASGDADLLTADGFKKLYFAPKSVYAKSSKFVMNRATMLAASLLKTGEGVYLLAQLTGTPSWNIMGSEVVEAKDMPDVSAGNFPVLFGDFKKGYQIVDRISLAILRDPYTQAATNSVRFHARKRLGAQVIQAETIWKLEIAAS